MSKIVIASFFEIDCTTRDVYERTAKAARITRGARLTQLRVASPEGRERESAFLRLKKEQREMESKKRGGGWGTIRPVSRFFSEEKRDEFLNKTPPGCISQSIYLYLYIIYLYKYILYIY